MLLESAKSMIAQAMQKGGVSPKTLAKPIETCIKVGMNSYFQLKPEQREQIDSLVQAALKYAESLKPQYPKIMEYVSNLNTANVTALIKIATKVLRKKSTAALVQQYLDVYVTVVNNPRRLKAIGAYMVCLLSNLDSQYKQIVVAVIDMLFAVVQLVSQTDLQSKVTQVSASVMKHIIRPMHKEINRKK